MHLMPESTMSGSGGNNIMERTNRQRKQVHHGTGHWIATKSTAAAAATAAANFSFPFPWITSQAPLVTAAAAKEAALGWCPRTGLSEECIERASERASDRSIDRSIERDNQREPRAGLLSFALLFTPKLHNQEKTRSTVMLLCYTIHCSAALLLRMAGRPAGRCPPTGHRAMPRRPPPPPPPRRRRPTQALKDNTSRKEPSARSVRRRSRLCFIARDSTYPPNPRLVRRPLAHRHCRRAKAKAMQGARADHLFRRPSRTGESTGEPRRSRSSDAAEKALQHKNAHID